MAPFQAQASHLAGYPCVNGAMVDGSWMIFVEIYCHSHPSITRPILNHATAHPLSKGAAHMRYVSDCYAVCKMASKASEYDRGSM